MRRRAGHKAQGTQAANPKVLQSRCSHHPPRQPPSSQVRPLPVPCLGANAASSPLCHLCAESRGRPSLLPPTGLCCGLEDRAGPGKEVRGAVLALPPHPGPRGFPPCPWRPGTPSGVREAPSHRVLVLVFGASVVQSEEWERWARWPRHAAQEVPASQRPVLCPLAGGGDAAQCTRGRVGGALSSGAHGQVQPFLRADVLCGSGHAAPLPEPQFPHNRHRSAEDTFRPLPAPPAGVPPTSSALVSETSFSSLPVNGGYPTRAAFSHTGGPPALSVTDTVGCSPQWPGSPQSPHSPGNRGTGAGNGCGKQARSQKPVHSDHYRTVGPVPTRP